MEGCSKVINREEGIIDGGECVRARCRMGGCVRPDDRGGGYAKGVEELCGASAKARPEVDNGGPGDRAVQVV